MTSRLPPALVVLPLLTLLSLAFSMLLGIGPARLVYARVWGGPPVHGISLRLQVIEEEAGLAHGLPGFPLTISGETAHGASVRELRTTEDGWIEVTLPSPVGTAQAGSSSHEPVTLELRASAGEPDAAPLARGRIVWSHASWLGRVTKVSGIVSPPAGSGLPITVRFEPPVLSVPFPGELELELAEGAGAVDVELSAQGAQIGSESVLHLEPGRPVRVRVVPSEHTATLALMVRTARGELQRSMTLPIVPGSLTAERDGPDLMIASPVPRSHAYYAVVTPEGRLGGGIIGLGPRPDGTAAGRLARGALPAGQDRYLVLSSSPDGQSPSVVGLPLDGQAGTWTARDLLLLDGRPRAIQASLAVRARLRFALSAYAGLGAMLCLVLFVWHIRRANERLREELAEVGAPAAVRERSLLGLTSAVLSLLFAFGLALTWILVR